MLRSLCLINNYCCTTDVKFQIFLRKQCSHKLLNGTGAIRRPPGSQHIRKAQHRIHCTKDQVRGTGLETCWPPATSSNCREWDVWHVRTRVWQEFFFSGVCRLTVLAVLIYS